MRCKTMASFRALEMETPMSRFKGYGWITAAAKIPHRPVEIQYAEGDPRLILSPGRFEGPEATISFVFVDESFRDPMEHTYRVAVIDTGIADVDILRRCVDTAVAIAENLSELRGYYRGGKNVVASHAGAAANLLRALAQPFSTSLDTE